MISSNIRWTIKHIHENQLDGHVEHFERSGGDFVLFHSRASARRFAKERYGYIAHRPDLKAEPFGWHMPQVVKVRVMVSEATFQNQTTNEQLYTKWLVDLLLLLA